MARGSPTEIVLAHEDKVRGNPHIMLRFSIETKDFRVVVNSKRITSLKHVESTTPEPKSVVEDPTDNQHNLRGASSISNQCEATTMDSPNSSPAGQVPPTRSSHGAGLGCHRDRSLKSMDLQRQSPAEDAAATLYRPASRSIAAEARKTGHVR